MEHHLFIPLKNKLKKQKFTMSEFSNMIGQKPRTFNNWIYGKYPMPEGVEREVEKYINGNIPVKVRIYLYGEVLTEINWNEVRIERDVSNVRVYLE